MEVPPLRGPPCFVTLLCLSQAGEDGTFLVGLSLTTSDADALGWRLAEGLLFYVIF